MLLQTQYNILQFYALSWCERMTAHPQTLGSDTKSLCVLFDAVKSAVVNRGHGFGAQEF
jgi:hypothetical protein